MGITSDELLTKKALSEASVNLESSGSSSCAVPVSVGEKRKRNEATTAEDDQGSKRPPGVKASKGRGKKKMAEGKALSEFLWRIKMEDLAMREKLSKMKILTTLIAKQEPLADNEEALKKKLIIEFLAA